jgi:hypothetical protein
MQPTPGWGEPRPGKPPTTSTTTWAITLCLMIAATGIIVTAGLVTTEPSTVTPPVGSSPSTRTDPIATPTAPKANSVNAAAHGRNIAALIRAQGGIPTLADCEAAFEEGVRGTVSGPAFLSNADHVPFLSACLSG